MFDSIDPCPRPLIIPHYFPGQRSAAFLAELHKLSGEEERTSRCTDHSECERACAWEGRVNYNRLAAACRSYTAIGAFAKTTAPSGPCSPRERRRAQSSSKTAGGSGFVTSTFGSERAIWAASAVLSAADAGFAGWRTCPSAMSPRRR
eukprot:6177467-Pleurochrysis_carterae.AAC.6